MFVYGIIQTSRGLALCPILLTASTGRPSPARRQALHKLSLPEKSKCTTRESVLFGARALARTPSLTLPIRCIYSAILNTLGAPLNPQDIPHNPHPCYKRTPSPSLMPGITGGLAPLLSPVLSSHLLLGSTHRKLGRDFGRTLSIPASLPYPPKTLPRQHPLRPRPSGHTLLPALRRGRRGRVFCSIPWHLLGRPPTGGGTAPELETLRCQRLSVKLRLWGLMRSDSDSSSMSDKRQSSHVQSQRVPESFRGESLVPRTAVLSQPLVPSPTACSENPRRLQGSERHVSAALCALRRAAVFFIPGFTRWETMIWGCWGEACTAAKRVHPAAGGVYPLLRTLAGKSWLILRVLDSRCLSTALLYLGRCTRTRAVP